MGKTKELLNNFYQNKKYDDEEFKFLKYKEKKYRYSENIWWNNC